MKNIILLAAMTFILFSCGLNEREIKEERGRKQENLKSIIIERLISKYDITYNWDTLEYNFTMDYDSVIKSRYQLIDEFEINDIFRRDSIEFISIRTRYANIFNFDLPISKEQEKILRRQDDDIILVVSIAEIKNTNFASEGAAFRCKGKIIEIVAIKKQI